MAFDPSISPLLTSINVADTDSYDLAASSNVIGSSTHNTDVVWGGPGGTFKIITTGNVASLAQLNTRGLVAIGTPGNGLVTALITEGAGISVQESGDDFLVSVIPNSTTQRIIGQCNSVNVGSPRNTINLIAGANVSITAVDSTNSLDYTINASGGGGGDASTWSEFPATEDVDMDGFGLTNVSSFQLVTGASNGYVLTSDADGIASWSASGGGDASTWSTFPAIQNVDMDGFEITGLTSLQVTTDAGSGKLLTSDEFGNASWQDFNPIPNIVGVTTIDASPTNIQMIQIPTGNCITVTGTVSAINNDKTDACGGNFSVTAFSSNSGDVTRVSPSYITLSSSSTATFDVNVDVGSGFVILTVTGIEDTTYTWVASYNSIMTQTA